MSPLNPRSWSLVLLTAAVFTADGCAVDVSRSRNGTPIDIDAYESLETGKSTLHETLGLLGAPDRLEFKSDDDYLWYLHRDTSHLGLRLQSPLPLLGYRHTVAELTTNAAETDTVTLVFDDDNVLSQKSIRLSQSQQELRETEEIDWEYFLIPTFGHSLQNFGDAGEVDFDELFDDGNVFGLQFGVMPVPFFMFLIGANYQVYNANTFRTVFDEGQPDEDDEGDPDATSKISVEDLELFQVEIGGRVQFPPAFFAKFWKLDELKMLFYSPDVRNHQGSFFYVKWALSGTYVPEVDVEVDGVEAGTYFDESYVLASTIGGGLEYAYGPFGAYLELLYQIIRPFDEGNVGGGIDTEASDFSNLLLSGGLNFRF